MDLGILGNGLAVQTSSHSMVQDKRQVWGVRALTGFGSWEEASWWCVVLRICEDYRFRAGWIYLFSELELGGLRNWEFKLV